MRGVRFILTMLAPAVLLAATAGAQPLLAVDAPAVPGSKARQVLLKQALNKYMSGTLVAELNHNRQVWGEMNPEQLREARTNYLAFLKEDPERQAKLLEAADAFNRLSPDQRKAYAERAEWLTQVVNALSPAEREELKALPPAERAQRLLELKAKLAAASQPATQPATQPAK